MKSTTDETKTVPGKADRPAQPVAREIYSPPGFAWEQEFVALASISGPPGGCDPDDPNPFC